MAAISIGSVQGHTVPEGEVEGVDAIHVVRDDEKIQTIENPTHKQFLETELALGNDEGLKITYMEDPDYCGSYCEENCDDNCEGYDNCTGKYTCSDRDVCCTV